MAGAIGARAEAVPIPWDCADGLFEAYWRRPGAYLENHVRRAMSVWTRVGPEAEQRAVRSLKPVLAIAGLAQAGDSAIGVRQRNKGMAIGAGLCAVLHLASAWSFHAH